MKYADEYACFDYYSFDSNKEKRAYIHRIDDEWYFAEHNELEQPLANDHSVRGIGASWVTICDSCNVSTSKDYKLNGADRYPI